MATFILVPGAMHGAWCWDRIVPRLEKAGHRAVAVSLPGTPENPSIEPAGATLAIWADHVADLVRQAEGPVLLAGHSRGGHVIGEAAERVPDEIAALIYVTAILSPPGNTMFDTMGYAADAVPVSSAEATLEAMAGVDLTAIFYHRCTPEDAAMALGRLYPEPYAPGATPAGVTWDRWGRVPRAYIECGDDQILTPDLQRTMQAKAPCDPVIRLDADHSPFLCAPDALARALLEVAERASA